jgi:hypothetical protein
MLGFAKGKKEKDGVCKSLLAGVGTKSEIPGHSQCPFPRPEAEMVTHVESLSI